LSTMIRAMEEIEIQERINEKNAAVTLIYIRVKGDDA